MPRSKTPTISLEEAKARFEEWRQNRKGKAAIPDELWAIAVGVARRENTENRLPPSEALRVLEEVGHHGCGHTLLNRENDAFRIAHQAKETFEHPVGRIGLRHKLRKGSALDEDLRAHQQGIIAASADVVAGENHGTRRGEMLEPVDLDASVEGKLVQPNEGDRRPTLCPYLTWTRFQGDCQKSHPGRGEQPHYCQVSGGRFVGYCFRHPVTALLLGGTIT